MIKDTLENAKNYYNLSENLKKGLEWLENTDLNNIADGKYEIEGCTIYANVQTYETKDNALYEAHRRYIDIQYMINGIEKIGVSSYKNCSEEIKYEQEKDIEFLNYNGNEEYLVLDTGKFIILFPNDAHKPSINFEKKSKVKKVVVKVQI